MASFGIVDRHEGASTSPNRRRSTRGGPYTIVNDISERQFQLGAAAVDRGKGCDTFARGAMASTRRDREPQSIDMWLDVNGEKSASAATPAP